MCHVTVMHVMCIHGHTVQFFSSQLTVRMALGLQCRFGAIAPGPDCIGNAESVAFPHTHAPKLTCLLIYLHSMGPSAFAAVSAPAIGLTVSVISAFGCV